VPVVENGKLIGIVSRADIIDMMAAEMEEPTSTDRPETM